MSKRTVLVSLAVLGLAAVLAAAGCARKDANGETKPGRINVYSVEAKGYVMSDKVIKSEEEWKKLLTPSQYHILREQGTERAYDNEYWDNHEEGVYRCAACGLDLYTSKTKYDSKTGWPSFWEPVAKENIELREDSSFFMKRTEVVCARCGSHLGHVFTDGPKPTGLRYCMNSGAMKFVKTEL